MTDLLQDLATTNELAAELRRAPETLVRWRRERRGPSWICVEGRVLYSRKHVQQWLEQQTCKAAAA